MNNCPFHIGQKVVCIDAYELGESHLIKNGEYIINEIKVECFFKTWIVRVNVNEDWWYLACRFAPVQYSDATAEILEKFTSPEESPDKIIQPQKAAV